MLMRYRLLVLDVDGTLLDSQHVLRPRVIEAVRAASAAGMSVSLATGKLLGSVRGLLSALELDGPQITLNGAAIQQSGTGEPLRFCPLKREDLAEIVRTVRAIDASVLVSRFVLDGIYMDEPHPMAGIFADYGEGPPRFVPDLLAPDLPPAGKILLSGHPEQLAAIRAAVTPVLGRRVTITTTTPDFLEFFDPLAGKGQALAALRAQLDVPREAVVAIGDGENDLPLFEEAGLRVAMGNAAPILREAANVLAPLHDEDGAAVVIEQLLRGKFDRNAPQLA